jgi:hypothetical protein
MTRKPPQANICVKYRREKYNKWVAMWDRWKPIELWGSPWKYWRGNMVMGGTFWRGFISNITLWSPLLNKLIHWKYRNMRLHVPYKTRDTLSVIERGDNEKG